MPVAAQLNRTGVWYFTDRLGAPAVADLARRAEELGYSAMWLPETVGRDPFVLIAHLAEQTSTLVFATGIANIFHRHPGMMMQAANTLAELSGGRFVLGVGVSHGPMVEGLRRLDYSKPLTKMRDYLATMDGSPYSGPRPAEPVPRLLAALGPKMLELARDHADGAHPYWTTPEHTAQARAILGAGKLLCVEQKVIVTTDAAAAREMGRAALGVYADLPNYRNNWLRLGFTEEDVASRSDRMVDALVAWGSADAVRRRIRAHRDAGADHVCIQPLTTRDRTDVDWAPLEALAPNA